MVVRRGLTTFLPAFSATVDYYDIRITGAIEAQNGVALINNCGVTGNPAVCDLIHRNANGSLWLTNTGFVTTLSENTGLLEDKGVDINLHYTWDLNSLGRLIFNLQGTDTLSNTTQPNTAVPDLASGGVVAGPSYNCAGFEGVTCNSPLPVGATFSAPTGRLRGRVSICMLSGALLVPPRLMV